ncbi:MAG: ABC transporter permease, partial [Desulfobacterales bacterium]|nr:ABC transporter permease [Desulfobacterales bacterium]
PKGKQLGCFSSFLDITRSEFLKTAQKGRKERLSLLFRTFCHVVYATTGRSISMRHQVILVVLLTLLVGATIWVTSLGKIGIYSTFTYDDLLYCAWAHFKMVLIAVVIATAIGVPLGVLVTRAGLEKLALPVIGGASVGQTVPSLAVIAIMAPLLGFGLQSAIVALVIYGLLPILRNSYASIKTIDPTVIEAARGMGLTRMQIARKIELPLARPVIMAGIRISTVITVGTAELAVLVGGEGLGKITLTGVFAREALIILQGAAPTAAMAITLGFLLERVERWMTPPGLKVEGEVS